MMRRGIAVLLAVLLFLSGCGAQTELPAAEQDGELTVSTDWSKLDERESLPPIGSRWYDEYTGQLIPRDDYGPLIPYAGLRLLDNWPAITGCLYGLMTTDGVVVTDAVYSRVISPSYSVGGRQAFHPLLALYTRTQPDEAHIDGRDSWALAAGDGSWCTEFCYRGIQAGKDGLLLFDDDSITYMSPTGEILNTWTMAEIGLTQGEIDAINIGLEWGEGYFGDWFGDYFTLGFTDDTNEEVSLLHLPTGQKETIDSAALWENLAQTLEVYQPDIEDFAENLPPGDYAEVNCLWDSFSKADTPALLAVSEYGADGGKQLFFLCDGTPLTEFTRKSGLWYYALRPVGGLLEVLDLNTASYYDLKTMDCVFRTYLGYDAD